MSIKRLENVTLVNVLHQAVHNLLKLWLRFFFLSGFNKKVNQSIKTEIIDENGRKVSKKKEIP